MNTARPNRFEIAPLCRWLLIATFGMACAIVFVYIKNHQHQLGEATRKIERQIAEERAFNEVLLARISALSSRAELTRKLQQGLIALTPIQDHAIARLTPPATAAPDQIARTASASIR